MVDVDTDEIEKKGQELNTGDRDLLYKCPKSVIYNFSRHNIGHFKYIGGFLVQNLLYDAAKYSSMTIILSYSIFISYFV